MDKKHREQSWAPAVAIASMPELFALYGHVAGLAAACALGAFTAAAQRRYDVLLAPGRAFLRGAGRYALLAYVLIGLGDGLTVGLLNGLINGAVVGAAVAVPGGLLHMYAIRWPYPPSTVRLVCVIGGTGICVGSVLGPLFDFSYGPFVEFAQRGFPAHMLLGALVGCGIAFMLAAGTGDISPDR